MSNGVGGSSANRTAAILFDAPLPAGAVLIATDVDTSRNDQIQFSNTGLQVALIEQLESIAGASSVFPAWDGSLQLLASASSTGNSSEAGDELLKLLTVRSISKQWVKDNACRWSSLRPIFRRVLLQPETGAQPPDYETDTKLSPHEFRKLPLDEIQTCGVSPSISFQASSDEIV